ncbi:TetR family transcriptional regulator [Gordonibacter sp. 28C]|uniref:TetR family transcriptional regulator n=1 Tax=Gordonibacter sp. 28C TaxID=2078569 RepID=UPI0013144BD2|nr:TetR family transcriptional regulator [Gordonibacter sp. 28C]
MSPKRYEAKLRLAEAFVRLVEAMPAERITVNMIAEASGKHRKTFYYHFADKEQLVVWLFRYDLASGLADKFPEDLLVREQDSPDNPLAEFPFYARRIEESGRIYNAPFFAALSYSLEKRRAYYRRIFSTRGPGTLDFYLHQLFFPAIKEDILFLIDREIGRQSAVERKALRERMTSNAGVDFLAEFYTGAFLSRFVERLNYTSARRTARDIIPFENVVHDSLAALIRQEIEKAAREPGSEDRPGKGGAPCASPA